MTGEDFMSILQTKNLTKIYGSGVTSVKALNEVTIDIQKGEFVAITGTSGSGKSTLLYLLGGLDTPSSGSVFINNFDIFSLGNDDLTIFRRQNIGFVFQNYNLLPALNVYENIILPIELDNQNPDTPYMSNVIETLGLGHIKNKLPNNLSGGQQQRVAIARALVTKPAIILADEPTGNLDNKTSEEVLSLLRLSHKNFHQTIVMITHDQTIAQQAERIIHIEDGCVIT